MIHEALIVKEIAFRYYKVVNPERKYDKESARKQFIQDKKIDRADLKKVIDKIFEEQMKLLK